MSIEKRDLVRSIEQRRKEALAVLAPRWRKCFWTAPFGHIRDGSRPAWASYKDVCLYCGKPAFIGRGVADLEKAESISDRFPIARGESKSEVRA